MLFFISRKCYLVVLLRISSLSFSLSGIPNSCVLNLLGFVSVCSAWSLSSHTLSPWYGKSWLIIVFTNKANMLTGSLWTLVSWSEASHYIGKPSAQSTNIYTSCCSCFGPFIHSFKNSLYLHCQIGSKYLGTSYSKYCSRELCGWGEGHVQSIHK